MTSSHQSNDPLHGLKLATIVEKLVEELGWQGMADVVRINCFSSDPSIKSSLKFLRKTPWARTEVENLYLATFHKADKKLTSEAVWPQTAIFKNKK